MALTVLTVLARGSDDVGAIGEEMVRWYRSRPRDVGNQTAAVLGGVGRRHPSAAEAASAYQSEHPEAAGNGALMRTGPVALAHLGDRDAVATLAADVAALTHPHPDSVHACVMWSLAIERAITTASPDEEFDWRGAVLAGLDHVPTDRHQVWRERIDEAVGQRSSRATDEQRVGGQSAPGRARRDHVDCRPAATGAVRPPRRRPARRRSVGRRHRHRGRHRGIAPRRQVGSDGGAARVAATAPRPAHVRRAVDPGRDLDSMARLAVNDGKPDGKGWPGVERLVPGYVREYGLVPLVVEIDGAWFGNAAGVEQAVRDGATVVISLCRMGTADVPAGVEHHTIGLIDTNLADNPNLVFVLRDTAATIDELARDGERVFTHCVAAQNRTPATAAAYLMARGASLDDALGRVGETFVGGPHQVFLRRGLEQLSRL